MGESDLLAHLARFGGRLRAAAIPVALTDEIDAASALALIDIGDRDDVYRALLAALKIRPRHREVFDALFERWWQTTRPSAPPRPSSPRPRSARHGPVRFPEVQRMHAEASDSALEVPDGGVPAYTSHPLLKRKAFETWTEAEVAAMESVMARLTRRLATRRSRRLIPTPGRGVADLRRSFRNSLATYGELFSLARRARPVERPRLVLLCDTSGSMDPHTRFLLAFVLSLGRVVRRPEVFVFNTSLTRVTRWLSTRRIGDVLDRVAAEVPDWSGGTRIGECLSAFVRDYLTATVTSKTVVVILSDGLDRGDPELLAGAMRSIHQAARRVIWLNPLMGDARYEPTARGMRAALPFVDQLAAAHDLASLERIVPSLTV